MTVPPVQRSVPEKPVAWVKFPNRDAVAVSELAVLIKPTAFLVTLEEGTHEVTRCYFQKGEFRFGVDLRRVGPMWATTAVYTPGSGLRLTFNTGHEMNIPDAHCQATWKL